MEQLDLMNQLVLMIEELDINQEKNVALVGNFNFFTDIKLEKIGGSPAFIQEKPVRS